MDILGPRGKAVLETSSDDIMTIRRIERIVLTIGMALLAVWVAGRLHAAISRRAGVARFEAADAASLVVADSPWHPILHSPVDFRLWSAKRISAYEDSLTEKTDAPLAILRIPKISLEVPVFNDTDDLTLNRGVGRILGTAQVGEPGNLGLAGHRDGFFRGLQSMSLGDVVELLRPRQTDTYTVSEMRIVTPEDVSVLNATAVPTLTLVTCFPFYFIGHAPQRYIVTAHLLRPSQYAVATDEHPIFSGNTTKNKETKR